MRKARLLMVLIGAILASCTGGGDPATAGGGQAGAESGDRKAPRTRVLTLAAYTTPREVYGTKIIPAFKEQWKRETGDLLEVRESYLGSGAQSRAVIAGFEADVVALSLEPDVRRIVEAGLIEHDWKAGPHKGMVSRSVVVLGVRAGNPLGIRDWNDLTRKDLEVLTPNVKTSGGAMWNIAAVFGAAMRGKTPAAASDPAAAEELLSRVLANVTIMDQGARESMLTFENGVGDVIITYENEMRVASKMGRKAEYVIPSSTILIENPVAVVDEYADAHGVRDVAQAFVEFLGRPETQAWCVEYGLRPVDESVPVDGYPPLADVFTIDDLGGWDKVTPDLFGPGGLYDRAMERIRKDR
jgi:sulfate transport system substrate-binding protein